MQDVIIARHGEIGIKSRNVRNRFERILIDNIFVCLKKNKIKYEKINRYGGRIYVFAEHSRKILNKLKNVFGIVSISPAKIVDTDIDAIKKEALALYKKAGKNKSFRITGEPSFRITAKRQTKEFELNSRQICEIVGAYVQSRTGANVNLSRPGIEITVEVSGKNTSVFSEYIKGMGGLPIGTQGKVLCMVSDRDSIIAVLEVLKRGCTAHLLFKNKGIAKKCKQVMKKYYYSKIPLKSSYGKSAEIAKDIGAYAVVYGETNLRTIKRMPKNEILLLFPLLGYNALELKQKTIALK